MIYGRKRAALALSFSGLLISTVVLAALESYLGTAFVLLCIVFPIYSSRRDDPALTLFSLVLAFLAVLMTASYVVFQFADILQWFALSLLLFFCSLLQLVSIIGYLKYYRSNNAKKKSTLHLRNILHLALTYSVPLVYLSFHDVFLLLKFIWILIPFFLLLRKKLRQNDAVILFAFGIGALLATSALLLILLAGSATVFEPNLNQLHFTVVIPGALYFGFSFIEHVSISWRSFKNLFLLGAAIETSDLEEGN